MRQGTQPAVPVSKLWGAMNARPRVRAATLARSSVPESPGVYAWYRDDLAIYVGKADNLLKRLWGNHMGRGKVMTGSAFRRNVAAHLGIATAADIKARRYMPTFEETALVNEWIRQCELAWIVCATSEEAIDLERRMKTEWMPPLTKV
jgi:hypothetical protein